MGFSSNLDAVVLRERMRPRVDGNLCSHRESIGYTGLEVPLYACTGSSFINVP